MKKRYLVDFRYKASIAEFYYDRETEKNYLVSGYKDLIGWQYISSRVDKSKPSFETFSEAVSHLKGLIIHHIEGLERHITENKRLLQEIEDAQASWTDTTNS